MNAEAFRIIELYANKSFVEAEATLLTLAATNSSDPRVFYKLARRRVITESLLQVWKNRTQNQA